MARPIPLDAPVTIATFPASEPITTPPYDLFPSSSEVACPLFRLRVMKRRLSVRFPESLAEVSPPAFRQCWQIACAAQEVLVRHICHEQVGDIRHRDPVRVPSDELKRVTSGDVSLLKDREVEAGPTAALEALDHIRPAKANAELKTRHPRLSDDEFGRTRAEAITNVYVAFQQSFSGEVLTEHAPREFCARQLCAPKRVVLRRVGIHRLVTPAVDGKVGLPIAFHIQRRHANPSCYGRLEDRRANGLATPVDLPLQAHVN